MEEADLMDDNHGLLEKLRLYEGRYLKRAAALLFHPDPEQYVTGANTGTHKKVIPEITLMASARRGW